MTTRKGFLRMSNLAERGARGVRQARHDFSRDRLGLDLPGMIRIVGRPDPLLKTFDREIASLQNAVTHREARAAPLPRFALDNDLIIETAGCEKPRALLHQGQPKNAV